MKLYAHQKRIIDANPYQSLIGLGTGGGKTRVCLELAEEKILVVCPKQQRVDATWQNNAAKFGISKNLTVVSKEEFRRDWEKLAAYDTVIFDECHTILGVTPDTRIRNKRKVPKASQLFEAAYFYLKKNKPRKLYLASATPVTKPMHLWAIALLFGKNWDFFSFREDYYFERKMGYHSIWLPRKDEATKNRLAALTKTFGYFGQLSDWFDVPDQTHKVIHVGLTPEQKRALQTINETEADPLVRRSRYRTVENGVLYGKKIEIMGNDVSYATVEKMVDKVDIFPSEKISHILDLAAEFPKMLIFCAYTAQINEIAKALTEEGYAVNCLTGASKDRGSMLQNAEKAKERIVIAQASISSGYELPSFPCVVYASKSYRYVDYEQSLGRVLRANALKKNLYVHLVVKDGVDEDCHNTIQSGQDFQEKVMAVDEDELSTDDI